MQLLHHDPSIRSHQVKPRPGKKLNIDPTKERPFSNHFAPDSKRWWRKGIRPKRDSFRARCYEAEKQFAAKVEQKKFANITEVAKYVRDFLEKPWFQRRFPQFQQCNVTYKIGTRVCTGGPCSVTPDGKEVIIGEITMSLWGMGIKDGRGGEIVVLHELAHAVLPHSHRHDRRWVRTFLEFVGVIMGQDVKKIFMIEFHKQGVSYNPIKIVTISEEHMQKLAAARPAIKRQEKSNGTKKRTTN